jgi:predicted nucleic acid-binding Zn ribbon protein
VDREVRRLGGPGATALAAVFARWEEVVGPQVAAHAQPVSIRAGTLVVGVDAPAWATQLRLLTATLLARLDEVAGPGAVSAVEVRVRPA